jgi:hypothetical protein
MPEAATFRLKQNKLGRLASDFLGGDSVAESALCISLSDVAGPRKSCVGQFGGTEALRQDGHNH